MCNPLKSSALRRAHILALCALSAGCIPLPFLPFHDYPGPMVANHFATNVEWEAKLTDGTVRRGNHRPCSAFMFFRPQPMGYSRTVFVERFTVWKDGALIGEYEGAKVEALGADGTAVLDEKGLRRLTGSECWRLFNTLDRDVHLSARYADSSTVTMTLRPCKRHVWTRDDGAVPTRMTITRDGAVLQDLDERAVRKTLKRHITVYTVGEAGIVGVARDYTAERCVECSQCKGERGQAAL